MSLLEYVGGVTLIVIGVSILAQILTRAFFSLLDFLESKDWFQ